MRFYITTILLIFSLSINAQKVEINGEDFVVKKTTIYKNKVDVTNTLSIEEKKLIRDAAKKKEHLEKEEKELKKQEKQREKLEKKQEKAEKKQKKAEKALKKKEKAQSSYNKASSKLEKSQKKYKKLKKKGKLSPEDEAKWLKKLEKLNDRMIKTEKRMKRS